MLSTHTRCLIKVCSWRFWWHKKKLKSIARQTPSGEAEIGKLLHYRIFQHDSWSGLFLITIWKLFHRNGEQLRVHESNEYDDESTWIADPQLTAKASHSVHPLSSFPYSSKQLTRSRLAQRIERATQRQQRVATAEAQTLQVVEVIDRDTEAYREKDRRTFLKLFAQCPIISNYRFNFWWFLAPRYKMRLPMNRWRNC